MSLYCASLNKRWVVMALFSHLHELDSAHEMVHHSLVTAGLPPFDGYVCLPPATMIQNGISRPTNS